MYNVLPISIVLHLKLTSTLILKEHYSIEKCVICLIISGVQAPHVSVLLPGGRTMQGSVNTV